MTTTNHITIVSPTTGSIVPEWVTVEVKVTDAPLRHNLQLFVYSADGKFYPQQPPTFDSKRDVFVFNCHVGFTVPNAETYTIIAVSNKPVWNIDAVMDDDTFASIPVIVSRK
jgi:hypothetical protein